MVACKLIGPGGLEEFSKSLVNDRTRVKPRTGKNAEYVKYRRAPGLSCGAAAAAAAGGAGVRALSARNWCAETRNVWVRPGSLQCLHY